MKARFRLAVVVAAVLCAFAWGCSSKKSEPKVVKAPPGGGDIAIQVTDTGFEPSRIEVQKGSNATLVFTRTSDKTCAKDVIIAGNGAHLDLPLNQPVRVALGSVNDTIPFECGAHMVKGAIIASR
jgi:plastocyanin domain-containing protein